LTTLALRGLGGGLALAGGGFGAVDLGFFFSYASLLRRPILLAGHLRERTRGLSSSA
jgi:hypothetical protein